MKLPNCWIIQLGVVPVYCHRRVLFLMDDLLACEAGDCRTALNMRLAMTGGVGGYERIS